MMMRSTLLAAALLAGSCDALVVGRAPFAARAAIPRSPAARLGLFDFLKPEGPDEMIGPVANPVGLTDEEMTALKTASISMKMPGRGPEKYDIIDNCPDSFLSDCTPFFPLTYFVLFRNERNMPPPEEVWDFVRKEWPVLGERSDDELKEALKPILAVYIDNRFVPGNI